MDPASQRSQRGSRLVPSDEGHFLDATSPSGSFHDSASPISNSHTDAFQDPWTTGTPISSPTVARTSRRTSSSNHHGDGDHKMNAANNRYGSLLGGNVPSENGRRKSSAPLMQDGYYSSTASPATRSIDLPHPLDYGTAASTSGSRTGSFSNGNSIPRPGSLTPTYPRSGSPVQNAANDEHNKSLPSGSSAAIGSPSLVTHYLPGKLGKLHRQGSRRHRGSQYTDEKDARRVSDGSALHDDDAAAEHGSGQRLTPKSSFSVGAFRRKSSAAPMSPGYLASPTFSERRASQPHPPVPPLPLEKDGRLTPEMPYLDRDPGSPFKPASEIAFGAAGLPKQPKVGAGRAAWGPDGGGEAALGAGDFEDDDGVDLEQPFRSDAAKSARPSMNTDDSARSNASHGLGLTDAGDNVMASHGIRRRPGAVANGNRIDAEGRLASSSGSGSSDNSEDARRRRIGFHHDHDGGAQGVLGSGTFGRIFAGLFPGKPAGVKKERLRWNKFKWALFVANTVLTLYALGTLIAILLTWGNVFDHSDVIKTANKTELILGTTAASLFFVTAIIGWCGILLNNRAFLAIYNLLLWISFAFLVAPGYVTYKKRIFNLEGKMNFLWSRNLNTDDRREIQDSLSCCGYYNPFIEAAESSRCYARSVLPGCKGRFLRFERDSLEKFYAIAFGLVAPHLIIIVTALLSSNHVTYRFGKGLTPQAYRLDEATARTIKDVSFVAGRESILAFTDPRSLLQDFLSHLSSVYGPGFIDDLLMNRRKRISQRVSLERVTSQTQLLDAKHGHSYSLAALSDSEQSFLEPPNRTAIFGDGRQGSFSSSEKGTSSPLHQSLGLSDLAQEDDSDAEESSPMAKSHKRSKQVPQAVAR